ncbi:cytochrome b5-like heme/steroid binding domain-containing protein, partial [Hygrophoropsis aurantiaca]
LEPPKTYAFTPQELAQFNGSGPNTPIYVAIKVGVVFDVTKQADFRPSGRLAIYSGRDGSYGLAKLSAKADDVISDWLGLSDKEQKILDDWFEVFRYEHSLYNVLVK